MIKKLSQVSIVFLFVFIFVNCSQEEKLLPPVQDAGGPTSFDWSIGPKLMKELQAGLVRFYASSSLIVVQHVRDIAPQSMDNSLETIKIILGRILKGGTPYSKELYELGRSFSNLRNQNIRSIIDTSYMTTPGPSLEIDDEFEEAADNTTSLWSRVRSWAFAILSSPQRLGQTLG